MAAVAAMTLAVAGLFSTAALGATKYELRFVVGHEPRDAEVNELIRAADLNDTAAFVQVEVVDASTGVRVTSVKGPIGFTLKSGAGFATGTLNVVPQPAVSGVATFGLDSLGEPTLSIADENEPQFTDYALVPVTTKGPLITADPLDPPVRFDIWEDGEACTGGTDTCDASLRDGNEQYTLGAAGTLGASELTGVLPGLQCPKQKAVFPSTVFSYATTGSAPLAPVFLSNHITREDWRASVNQGQAHADWCIGLLSPAAWQNNGASFTQLDTDGNGTLDLYVAVAPNCPVANPSAFAPCIVSQNPDGDGGSITTGWLPGGDPPRRT